MNELMLKEIASQPTMLTEALANLRDQAAKIDARKFRQIVLTGSGDSGYAAMAVEDLFHNHLRVPVFAVPSITAARYPRTGHGDMTVLISVSGEVKRTIEAALTAHVTGARTMALVANGESSLARHCDSVLVMPKPISRATPHTRDYTATLLALGVLAERLAGARWPNLDRWADAIEPLIDASLSWAAQIDVSSIDTRVWFLGSGPDRGTAAYGALKFWEAGGELSWWDDLEEFAHGSQLQARPGDDVFVFATGAARSRAAEMLSGLLRMEMRVFAITDSGLLSGLPRGQQLELPPVADQSMLGFYSCIPVQAITYAYACARNIDVTVPMGGARFGQTYEDVHNEWMRNSVVEERVPG